MKKKPLRSTKQRILDTALRLFNQQGLAKVTLRQIAQAAQMSQGNLNYHFKKREELVEALYLQLVEEMNALVETLPQGVPSLAQLRQSAEQTMQRFYAYRFFLLDFVHIMRQQPRIKAHYQALTARRTEQFSAIFNYWIAEGIIREAAFPEEYEQLYTRMQILGDFWLSAAFTKNKALSTDLIAEYNNAIFAQFYPYLTKRGRAEFLEI
jgi:AcrR family transcriptional regulator